MTITKKYLTAHDIIAIADEMKNLNNYIAREATKWIMITHTCTDYEIQKDENGLILITLNTYDKLCQEKIIDELMSEVYNYGEVDKQYQSLVDVKYTAYKLVNDLADKIKDVDMSKFDLKGTLAKLSKTIGDMKNDTKK